MKIIVDYFEYAEFHGGVPFFYFKLEILFLGKFSPKSKIASSR